MKQFRLISKGGSVDDVIIQTGRFVFHALFNGKPVKIFLKLCTAMKFPSLKD